MPTYLVTGAAGFIGFHLARLLASSGHRVIAADIGLHDNASDQFAALAATDGVEVLRVDLTDLAVVGQLPKVDGVFHLAALNGTENFYSRPFETAWHSTVTTMALLRHFGEVGTGFFFYAGSSESYASTVTLFDWPVPTAEDVPLSISDAREIRWSYGASKLHGEVACFAAQAQYKMPVVVGRFHNAYGPRMGIHHVIPDFISRGLHGTFSLYGAEHTRSFIYIDDAVRAVVVLAEQALGEVVNIGSPDEVTMRELAEVIMDEAGWSGEVEEHEAPSGSVLRRSPDLTRLATFVDIGGFTPLREGIRRVLPEYLSQGLTLKS